MTQGKYLILIYHLYSYRVSGQVIIPKEYEKQDINTVLNMLLQHGWEIFDHELGGSEGQIILKSTRS